MARSICVGLGDILITKMLYDTHGLKDDILINFQLIDQYRDGNESNKAFIKEVLTILFKDIKITYFNSPHIHLRHYLDQHTITSTDLSRYFDTSPVFPTEISSIVEENPTEVLGSAEPVEPIFEKYVLFHTKCRFDHCMSAFLAHDKALLADFYKKYVCKYKIVIVGEREISGNIGEVRIHNIQTIYNDLMHLKCNNEILDLTQPNILDNASIDKFKYDVRLVHNAVCNFGVGFGGNFVMSTAFGKCSWYTGGLVHKYMTDIRTNKVPDILLHTNLDSYLNSLTSLSK